MPKHELDSDDPLELNGVALLTQEDTTDQMCECFVEEFMRMGYSPEQILALFRSPQYLGVYLVLERRGEDFIRRRIMEVFARWGKPFSWRNAAAQAPASGPAEGGIPANCDPQRTLTDSMGGAIPKLNP